MTKGPEDNYKCEPLQGPGDADALKFGLIWQAAALGLTAVATVVSSVMLNKQLEIAKQYLAISKGWYQWYSQGYAPLEDKEVAEAMAQGAEEPFYDAAVGRARALGRLMAGDMAEAAIRCTNEYQTGLRLAALRDAMAAEAEMLASLSDLGWRVERDRVAARDAETYARKLQVLNRGRDMAAEQVAYGSGAGKIFADLAGQGGANFTEFLGYALKKRKTDYGDKDVRLGLWRKRRDVGYKGLDSFDDRMEPILYGYHKEEAMASLRERLEGKGK